MPIDRYVAESLKEIADEIGVTPMRVHQIEQAALRKIKTELLSRGIVTTRGQYASGT